MCVIEILFLSLNTMLIVDKHCCDVSCDEFPDDRKSKHVEEQTWKILFAISMWKNSLF